MTLPQRPRILFLCTGNSSRSQMAEGLLRDRFGDRFEALSAGSQPAGYVHPLAVEAMREIGIDVSGQRSKSILEFLPPAGKPPDLLISVCDSAARECPVFPAAVERLHWPFADPGHVRGTPAERLKAFRQIRDQIDEAIKKHFRDGEPGDASPDETGRR
jgi:arsenate reductase